jgi:tRNA(Ile)-lysidine synthase
VGRAPARVAVATSGGRDSTALLHCAAHQGRALGVEVHALHVHHGLMARADAWQGQVAAQCRRWGVGFATLRLQGAPARGDSVEAWARRGRYRALAQMARERGIDLVLLAHHRRDQAETFLIQALRGGGAAGLAAMPREVERDGITWARPWLDQPRSAIDAYLRRHRLRFVDDASNDDLRFARGRLRAALWPALLGAFPDAETTLARAAARAAQESALLAQVARADLGEVAAGDGALVLPNWLALSAARRVNVLRAWLGCTLPEPVPETLVRRLADELPACVHGQWPAGSGWLRLRRRRLRFEPMAASPARQSGEASPA